MRVEKTRGLVAAAFSTLRNDGSLNLTVIPEYADFLKSRNVVGVFVNGSSGEGFSLATEERMDVADAWVEASRRVGIKAIVHVGHTSAAEERRMAVHAREIGASGFASIGPIYYKAKAADRLVGWCAQTAAAAPDLPYYYYNIPRMSGNVVNMAEFIALAGTKIPNFVGIKFSDPNDFPGLLFCQRFDNSRFDIMHGQDESLLSALATGVTSAIGSTYSFAAPIYNKIIAHFNSGDMDEAREYQLVSVKLVAALAGTGDFFSACKAVMRWLGLDLGPVRPPLGDLSGAALAGLKEQLEAIKFFELCG
ncbi:MAG: dihydrodipicolinate synthase family protein [Candidatus Lokiarchaeota archaeon]|nr:dihydrodipicolinate synthase family protein [Candidatus Lokiarchaeota archaeon]